MLKYLGTKLGGKKIVILGARRAAENPVSGSSANRCAVSKDDHQVMMAVNTTWLYSTAFYYVPTEIYILIGKRMQSLSAIPFTVERSKKRRKSIAIMVNHSRGVIIQAPHRTPDAYIQEVITKREGWIQKKWIALQQQLHEQDAEHFENGRILPLLDKRYILEIWPLPAQKNQYECIDHILLVRLKKQDKLPQQEQIKKLVERWYRQQASTILAERSRYFAQQMNVQPQGIIIKTQKNRWGSCDRHNVIRYNWKVIMAPSALLDYLVVHELAHIREKNHSPAFWAVVASVLPDYMQLRKALREFHPCW